MKVLKNVFFIIPIICLGQINAQTSPGSNDKLKSEAEKVISHRKAVTHNSNASAQVKARNGAPSVDNSQNNTLDENDAYMGRKAEFLNNLTVSELPVDFPRYDKSYGLGGYNIVVDNYYAQHTDILKPGVKAKIMSSHPSNKN